MKARGMGSIYVRGRYYWLQFGVGGRRIRIATGIPVSPDGKIPKVVRQMWTERLAELGRGNLAGVEMAPTFDRLAENLMARYQAEGRAVALKNFRFRLKHLAKWFGGLKADAITDDLITRYAVRRKDQGAAVDTINLELAFLKRMIRLAYRRIPNPPRISRLPGSQSRQGVIPDEHMTKMLGRLRPDYACAALFLRLTGWRCDEGLGLEWERVDWAAKVIKLDTSKSGRARFLAFGKYKKLHALLRLQRIKNAAHPSPWVFRRHLGTRIHNELFRGAWTRVRNRFGYPYRIHDLRRTRVAELERNGVPMTIGMSSVGIETPTIYRRYGVVSQSDQADWMGKVSSRPRNTLDIGNGES